MNKKNIEERKIFKDYLRKLIKNFIQENERIHVDDMADYIWENMEKYNSEKLSLYEIQSNIISDFFDGKYYIVLKSNEERQNFLKFISKYDVRFAYGLKNQSNSNIKSAMWIYSKELHHHQLEISESENYFKDKSNDYALPIEYSNISYYVKVESGAKRAFY